MEANMVQLGGYSLVLLPEEVAQKMAAKDIVTFDLSEDETGITLQPLPRRHLREGWEAQLRVAIALHGNVDENDIADWSFPNEFDEKEWT